MRCSATCLELAHSVHSRVIGVQSLLKGVSIDEMNALEDLRKEAVALAGEAKTEVDKATAAKQPLPDDVDKRIREKSHQIDQDLERRLAPLLPALEQRIKTQPGWEKGSYDDKAFDAIKAQYGVEKAIEVFSSPLAKRLVYKPRRNLGEPRSVGEVRGLAERFGVDFSRVKNVEFRLDSGLPMDTLAKYLDLRQGKIPASFTKDFLISDDKPLVISLNPAVLESDEAIVAAVGHEMHEINGLLDLIEENGGEATATTVRSNIGALHQEAMQEETTYIRQVRDASGVK
jgi:hypothetical protein